MTTVDSLRWGNRNISVENKKWDLTEQLELLGQIIPDINTQKEDKLWTGTNAGLHGFGRARPDSKRSTGKQHSLKKTWINHFCKYLCCLIISHQYLAKLCDPESFLPVISLCSQDTPALRNSLGQPSHCTATATKHLLDSGGTVRQILADEQGWNRSQPHKVLLSRTMLKALAYI